MLGFASRPTRTQAVLAAVAIAAVLGALVPYRLVSARPGNAEAPRAESSTSTEVWVDAGDADASRPNALPFAFGVLEGGHTFLYGSFNRAQQADVEEARERSGDVRTLWFRLHDRTYTSTDARLLHEVGETLEPLTSMSSSQARLGSAQGSLGEQQGAIGQREAELAHRQARLEQAIGELEESLAETRESGPKVREIRARIAKLQSEVDAIEASTQALESQVGDLDRAQDSLGVMQDKLQNRLDEISPAVVRQIRKLSEEAIADGRAVRQR